MRKLYLNYFIFSLKDNDVCDQLVYMLVRITYEEALFELFYFLSLKDNDVCDQLVYMLVRITYEEALFE